MKLYKVKIKPISPFATELKGDTLFGNICWGIVYLKGEEKLKELLNEYEKNPFLIVSDAFVSGYLLKPTFPREILGELDEGRKKEYKKKIWLKIDTFIKADFNKAEKLDYKKDIYEVKNNINYLTFTTGEGFAPYLVDSILYTRDLDIYLLIKDEEKLIFQSLELIGNIGYGKDSNLGKGRFEVLDVEEVSNKWFKVSKYFMTLSDCDLSNIKGKIYYDVATKFPKSRGDLKNPFKNPLLMAKKGAGIILDVSQELKFIGKAIKGFINDEKIVHQGYAITLPIGVSQ